MKQCERDCHTEGNASELAYARLMVNGWLCGNAGMRFSIHELEIELEVSQYFIEIVLKDPEIGELFVYDPIGSNRNYMSTAAEPFPTDQGRREMGLRDQHMQDILGAQARDEFYHRQHDPYLRRKRKSITVAQRY